MVGKTMMHYASESNRAIERICRGTWRLANSPRVALVLLFLLLVIALLGGVLTQAPPGASGEAIRFERVAQGRESRLASEALGSWVVRILFGIVVAISILRMLGLWASSWPTKAVELMPSLNVALPLDVDAASDRVSSAFKGVGQEETRHIDVEGTRYVLYKRAGRKRWLGSLFYLGVLILMLASLIQTRYGWVGSPENLALGESRVLDPRSGLAVRLDQIDGTLQRLDSRIAISEDGQVEHQANIGLGRPARYGGMAVYQLGLGDAARVSVQRKDGKALNLQQMLSGTALQQVLRVRFSEQQQEQLVAVPEVGLIVQLVNYPNLSAEGERTLRIQVLQGRDGHLLAEELLTDAGEVTAGEVIVRVVPEYYVILLAEREPELPFAVLGGALVLLGIFGLVVWPPRENWVSISKVADGSRCCFFAPAGDVGAEWLRRAHTWVAEVGDE